MIYKKIIKNYPRLYKKYWLSCQNKNFNFKISWDSTFKEYWIPEKKTLQHGYPVESNSTYGYPPLKVPNQRSMVCFAQWRPTYCILPKLF